MAARRRGWIGAPPESGATVGWSCADAEVSLGRRSAARPACPRRRRRPRCRLHRLAHRAVLVGREPKTPMQDASAHPGITARAVHPLAYVVDVVWTGPGTHGGAPRRYCAPGASPAATATREARSGDALPDLGSRARSGAAEEEMSARRNSATGAAGPQAPAGACFAVKGTLAARRTATLRPRRYPFGTNELRIPETAKGAREEAQEGREKAKETGTNPLVSRDRQRRERHSARAFGLMRSAPARPARGQGRGVPWFATGAHALPAGVWKPSHPSTPVRRGRARGRLHVLEPAPEGVE